MKIIPVLKIQEFGQDVSLSHFYCSEINAHLDRNKNHFHRPHKHNFFLCVLFTKGSGVHEIDFNSYDIMPGTVFFLRPGQTHYWKFQSTPEGYIFFHTQDFYDLNFSKGKLELFPFYYSYDNEPLLLLKAKDQKLVESRFKELNDECRLDMPYKSQKIASLINATYIDLARHYIRQDNTTEITSSSYSKTLRLLEKSIEKHFTTEKSAHFYADRLNITPKHLNRIVKTTLGKTTTDLIMDRVILESKRLIIHSSNSLSTISAILGYQDYAYFSRLFKIRTHRTPSGFKNEYKQNLYP